MTRGAWKKIKRARGGNSGGQWVAVFAGWLKGLPERGRQVSRALKGRTGEWCGCLGKNIPKDLRWEREELREARGSWVKSCEWQEVKSRYQAFTSASEATIRILVFVLKEMGVPQRTCPPAWML